MNLDFEIVESHPRFVDMERYDYCWINVRTATLHRCVPPDNAAAAARALGVAGANTVQAVRNREKAHGSTSTDEQSLPGVMNSLRIPTTGGPELVSCRNALKRSELGF